MQPEQSIIPDKWILIINKNTETSTYHILSGWNSSYLYGGSWRLSSNLEEFKRDNDNKMFYAKTVSGSTYVLHDTNIGVTIDSSGVLDDIMAIHDTQIATCVEECEAASVEFNKN